MRARALGVRDGFSVIFTTVLVVAGLHLAHAAGVGLVLKIIPELLVTSAALAEIEAYIFPAVIAWSEGPIVSDRDGETYYPIIGECNLKEANG